MSLCPVSSTAQAPGLDAQRDEEARLLFNAATSAFLDGRFAVALDRFREAYGLSHRPELLYNIGLAADRMRLDEDALAAFEEYLTRVPLAENRREVEGRVAILRTALARREQAAVNSAVAVATPAVSPPVAVEPGAERAAATESEVGVGTESPTAPERDGTSLSSTSSRLETSAPPPLTSSRSVTSVVGPTLIGLGGATLGMSGVALVLRNREATAFNADSCIDGGRTRGEACGSHLEAGRRWERTAIVGLAGGVGLTAVGTVLLIVGSARRSGAQDVLAARCVPALGATLGVDCQMQF